MDITTNIVEKCSDTSIKLQAYIMGATELSAFKSQKLCAEVLFRFAKCPALCSTIIRQLAQGISAVSFHLKSGDTVDQDQSGDIPPDYILFENVSYLLKTLEAVLNHLLQEAHQNTCDLENDLQQEQETEQVMEQDSEPTQIPGLQKEPGSKGIKSANIAKSVSENAKKGKRTKQVMTGNIVEFFDSVKNSQQFKDNGRSSKKALSEGDCTSSSSDKHIPMPDESRKIGGGGEEVSSSTKGSGYQSIAAVVTRDVVFYLQEAMENALLYTCDDFPLFSYYVWKISCLVEEFATAAQF